MSYMSESEEIEHINLLKDIYKARAEEMCKYDMNIKRTIDRKIRIITSNSKQVYGDFDYLGGRPHQMYWHIGHTRREVCYKILKEIYDLLLDCQQIPPPLPLQENNNNNGFGYYYY